MTDDSHCPCGSCSSYAACCGRFLERSERPETAEQLMRSRYTAHTLGREDYLLRSWHPSTRPKSLRLGDAAGIRWIGLKILSVEDGGPEDSEGLVEFVARHKVDGKASRLHELSRFAREGSDWFYVDGKMQGSRSP